MYYYIALCLSVFNNVSLWSTAHYRDPNGGNMKMKSAKKKSLLNNAKTAEKQDGEYELKLEEDSYEVYTNGGGLNILIKEEPLSQEISEEQNGDSSSSCLLDTKPDITVASWSDVHYQQGLIKDECDSDHQPEYEFTETAVKEETESWIKEERDCEEEAASNIQEDYGEGEEVCTATGRSSMNKHEVSGYYLLFIVSVLFYKASLFVSLIQWQGIRRCSQFSS